jgi:hypothetical protein
MHSRFKPWNWNFGILYMASVNGLYQAFQVPALELEFWHSLYGIRERTHPQTEDISISISMASTSISYL